MQGPRLGSAVDYEANGIPTANSDGDDLNGSDDEDGVLLSTLTVGITQPVTVILSNAVTAFLDAWIDFNANGIFGPGEQVAASVALASGANAVSISVPGAAILEIEPLVSASAQRADWAQLVKRTTEKSKTTASCWYGASVIMATRPIRIRPRRV